MYGCIHFHTKKMGSLSDLIVPSTICPIRKFGFYTDHGGARSDNLQYFSSCDHVVGRVKDRARTIKDKIGLAQRLGH